MGRRKLISETVTTNSSKALLVDLPPLLVPPLKLEFRIIQTVVT